MTRQPPKRSAPALRDLAPRKKLLLFGNAIRVADADVIVELEELAEILPADGTGGLWEIKRQLLWGWCVGHGWTSPGAHSDGRCAPNICVLVTPKLPSREIQNSDGLDHVYRSVGPTSLKNSNPPGAIEFSTASTASYRYFCACIADFDFAKESGP